jgi:hypothetical protein
MGQQCSEHGHYCLGWDCDCDCDGVYKWGGLRVAIESDERDLVVLLFAGQREYEKKPSGLYAALCSACCVWARGSNNPRLNRSGLRQVKEKKNWLSTVQ